MARYKVDEHDLFDAENLNNVEGLELLHPVFRKGRINDIVAHEKRFFGKYDLFIDNSGSMGSSAGLQGHSNVSCMLLAKAVALRMKRLDLLNNLYEFQGSVTKVENTELAILDMCARGGTSLDSVIREAKRTGNNSVILTDAEDVANEYLDNIVFLGVSGVRFEYFRQSEVGKKYIANNQCMYFDGQTVEYTTL